MHLPGAFDAHWLETLGRGIERDLADPSPRFEARTTGDSAARYCEDFWVWSEVPELGEFVRAKGERALFEAAGYGDGDAIDGGFFPRLWPR